MWKRTVRVKNRTAENFSGEDKEKEEEEVEGGGFFFSELSNWPIGENGNIDE